MFTRKNRNGIQEMSRSSGHYPIRRKFPRETHFSANSSKRFSLQKKSYSPAGLFQITIFRRCDPHTRTWSDSASEDYASSSFPFERASELPATFHSQAIVKDPSTEYQVLKEFPQPRVLKQDKRSSTITIHSCPDD